MKVRDTGFSSPQSTFEMSTVRKTFSDQAGNPTNLTDMAGGTTKDANDTKSAVHRLASSCSSSSSFSVVLTSRNTCEAGGHDPFATWPTSTTGGVADGRFVYHSDALGSAAAITDELQATVRTYTYEAFGKLRATTGTGPVGGNRFTYTGREPLGDSGALYYYRWRVMDPNVGRFTSEDPLGFVDGVNVYAYARANPYRWMDPSGLFCEEECKACQKKALDNLKDCLKDAGLGAVAATLIGGLVGSAAPGVGTGLGAGAGFVLGAGTGGALCVGSWILDQLDCFLPGGPCAP